ncbi:MAG: hypothetical protein AABY22_23960 [Nanoarchaeota archaeon]
MITTLDGIKVKNGDFVWEIGTNGNYRPTLSVVGSRSPQKRVVNPDRCWGDLKECEKECDKLNRAIRTNK